MNTKPSSIPRDIAARLHARPQRPQAQAVPDPQGAVARQLFDAVTPDIDPAALSFGGGTVLAARWQHRTSADVDLFCRPDVYEKLDGAALARVEAAVRKIPGCDRERTWCETMALYTEIQGIEATILPGSTGPNQERQHELAGTPLRLQNTDEILYGKLFERLYRSATVTVRDVYDVASADRHDRPALQRVLAHLSRQIPVEIDARLASLPRGWSRADPQPVIDPVHDWTEAALVDAARFAMQPGPRGRQGPER